MKSELKGYFLSDLHLFARRSTANSLKPLLGETASRAHTMVLGGDIFDFKWSTFCSFDESIAAAIAWLEELIVSQPQCCFYYLLGNHDAHPKFVVELDRLSFRQPRLQWQPYVLRIMDCVFLHGDIVDCEPNHTILESRRKVHEFRAPQKRIAHWLYDMAVHARLHRLVMHAVVRPRSVLRKLSRYLHEQGLDASHGVRHVYFGHTHRSVNGVLWNGLTFHNGGASIRGLNFRIVETQLPHDTSLSVR